MNYYVPAGVWTNLLNGSTVEGPLWIRETYDFMSLPLLVRLNTILPVGSQNDRPDSDYSDGVTLKIFQLENGRHIRVEIPTLTGNVETVFKIRRDEDVIYIERQGLAKDWTVLLINIHSIETNETVERTPEGMLLTPPSSANVVEPRVLP